MPCIVGGKDEPSVAGFEDFTLRLSNYLDKEVRGKKGGESTSLIYTYGYDSNTAELAHGGFNLYNIRPDLIGGVEIKVDFHTHISRFGDTDRLSASGSRGEGGGDMQLKKQLRLNQP